MIPNMRLTYRFQVDHPHGGGRGKSKGNRHPTSPWGTPVRLVHLLRDNWFSMLNAN